MATWRKKIRQEMDRRGESWVDLEACTLTDAELEREFGNDEGEPFTAWTQNRVYFPAYYDGYVWCASVSRRPDGKPTAHVGGG